MECCNDAVVNHAHEQVRLSESARQAERERQRVRSFKLTARPLSSMMRSCSERCDHRVYLISAF